MKEKPDQVIAWGVKELAVSQQHADIPHSLQGRKFYLCVDTNEWNKYFKIADYAACRWVCLGRAVADAKYLICALIQQQGSARSPPKNRAHILLHIQ